jgi:hypothetical protein
MTRPKPPADTTISSGDKNTDRDLQVLGLQVSALANVLVVACVEFGLPLTPGQQSSIMLIIAVCWGLFANVYSIRHRVTRTRKPPEATTKTVRPRRRPQPAPTPTTKTP